MSWNELFPYLMIAPMTAAIGWFTNFIGIKMMFYPVNFIGFGGFIGWQGVIPRLRVRLVRNLVNISVAKICSPKELMDSLADEDLQEYILKLITPSIDDWIDEVMIEEEVQAWNYAPSIIKSNIFSQVEKNLPSVANDILSEFSNSADRLVDIACIAEHQVRENPEILNELFLRCAGKELSFVIRSGLYFGLPLGIIQAVLWYLYPYVWVLPLFGVLVGSGTNWIALKLIAHPANPVMLGAIRIQGLYLRRQSDVSKEFAEIFASKFLSPKAFIDYLWLGPKSLEIHRIVHRHIRKALDKNMLGKILAQFAVSPTGYENLRIKSVEYAADRFRESVDSPDVSKRIAQPVIELIAGRMTGLKPKEFQQLLLPAFEQDQFLVVLLGGVLGGMVGFGQLVFLFDWSF
jgi:uncharacterized membrane protein YheB (UPF0754 family)